MVKYDGQVKKLKRRDLGSLDGSVKNDLRI